VGRTRLVAVITFALTVLVVPRVAAEDQESRRAAELAARWSATVSGAIAKAKAVQSDISARLTRDFLIDGATRAAREGKSDKELLPADSGVVRLAAELIAAAEKQPDGTLRIGEGSFGTARGRLCPLYPFC
jgi:hypothetical protein